MPKQMERDQAFGIPDAAGLLSGEPTTGTVTGEATVTHTPERAIEPQLNRLCESMVIKDLEISLGDETISVGKQAMFYRAHYVEIGEEQSKIAPIGKYVTMDGSGGRGSRLADAAAARTRGVPLRPAFASFGNITLRDPLKSPGY
jgi:hypothetical protein